MEFIDYVGQILPTVAEWFETIFDFLIPIAKALYVDIYQVIWNAIGIPEWIPNTIITVVSVGLTIKFLIEKVIPF